MFTLNQKYEVNRNILKCDYIQNSSSEISTINTPNSQTYIDIPREDNANSVLDDRLDLNFDVLHAATGNRYVDANDISLINFSPIALFSKYDLTSSSGKHLESIDHAHFACLMYKLKTSARGSDDLSIGFDPSRDRRKRELTDNKNIKGKYHDSIYLWDVFGYSQWLEKAIVGLG